MVHQDMKPAPAGPGCRFFFSIREVVTEFLIPQRTEQMAPELWRGRETLPHVRPAVGPSRRGRTPVPNRSPIHLRLRFRLVMR